MKKDEIFEKLVSNAFDFLEKSISELDDFPKYSMINFYSSIELFLKARLLNEHWSLIISRRKDPDYKKFLDGDFQSISLDESAKLLDKVVRSGISLNVLKNFKELGNHRNKVIHFFHKDMFDEKEKREIVKLQLHSWYHLHRLLGVQWKDVFGKWNGKIKEIERKLKKYKDFLEAIYLEQEDSIEKDLKVGVIYHKCPSCGFTSQKHDDEYGSVYYAKCSVCGFMEKVIKYECPDCKGDLFFENEASAVCEPCDKVFDGEDLLSFLEGTNGDYKSGEPANANCECGGLHTVGVTVDDEYLCVSCFGVYESLSYCDFCNELNTGDMENSGFFGCSICDGAQGWDSD